MGWVRGFEPPTFGATNRRSNQLSYTHHIYFSIISDKVNLGKGGNKVKTLAFGECFDS